MTNAEKKLLKLTLAALETARCKHLTLGCSIEQALRYISAEHKEFEAQATLIRETDGTYNVDRMQRAREESLDCVVVHLRFLLGEYVIGLQGRRECENAITSVRNED